MDVVSKRAVIIGTDVTKGARSPMLWNACFKHYGIKASMEPVDLNELNTVSFLKEATKDQNFIGGAVASPLKEIVAEFFQLEKVEFNEPKNCFFRDSSNKFKAVNTDTLAAVESINCHRELNNIKSICFLGTGAVSKSLANNFKAMNVSKYVFGRSDNEKEIFESFGFKFLSYEYLTGLLKDFDLLVNCTSVGRDGREVLTLINKEDLLKVNKSILIFDVNYINSPSQLLKDSKEIGLECIDGSRMNLMQAALAFNLANNDIFDQNELLEIMVAAIS